MNPILVNIGEHADEGTGAEGEGGTCFHKGIREIQDIADDVPNGDVRCIAGGEKG